LKADTRTVASNGVEIAAEAFGDPNGTPLLLVMGATASMLGWPEAFLSALAGRGLYAIRFDHRDTGRSTSVGLGHAAYNAEDMVGDMMAVLDGYGIERAHLVGMSLGGYLSQMAALQHPRRVASLTLIGSEPLGWDGEPLPHISPAFLNHFAERPATGQADFAKSASPYSSSTARRIRSFPCRTGKH
jgi:pimeloyl-ACP methyl ester carboxylesterase